MAKKKNDKSSIDFNPGVFSNPKVYGPPKKGPKNITKREPVKPEFFDPSENSNPKVYGPPKNGPKNVVKKMLERQKISILYGPPKEDSKEVRNKPGKKKK